MNTQAPNHDALLKLRRTRSDMLGICRRAKATPDSLAGVLAPFARGHYRYDRRVAMRAVVLPGGAK